MYVFKQAFTHEFAYDLITHVFQIVQRSFAHALHLCVHACFAIHGLSKNVFVLCLHSTGSSMTNKETTILNREPEKGSQG